MSDEIIPGKLYRLSIKKDFSHRDYKIYLKFSPKPPDENGNSILLTNLVTRARLIEQLQNNPMLFYEYAIQDGDTPEIIAEKYYGDPFRYWIILLSNELLDPLWDWPLSDAMLLEYIDTKYATEAEDANETLSIELIKVVPTIKYFFVEIIVIRFFLLFRFIRII